MGFRRVIAVPPPLHNGTDNDERRTKDVRLFEGVDMVTRMTTLVSAAPQTAPKCGWESVAERLDAAEPGMIRSLVFLRHGETVLNARRLVSGAADTDLTRAGRFAAVEAGRACGESEFSIAFSSPLRRSRETLRIMAAAGPWSIGRFAVDSRIAERSLGALERRPAQHLDAYASGDFHWAPEGGESYASLALRLWDFLADLLHSGATEPLDVVACSHLGPMRLLKGMCEAEEDPVKVLDYKIPNLTPIYLDGDKITLPPFLEEAL